MMLAELLVTLSWIGAGAAVFVGVVTFSVNSYREGMR